MKIITVLNFFVLSLYHLELCNDLKQIGFFLLIKTIVLYFEINGIYYICLLYWIIFYLTSNFMKLDPKKVTSTRSFYQLWKIPALIYWKTSIHHHKHKVLNKEPIKELNYEKWFYLGIIKMTVKNIKYMADRVIEILRSTNIISFHCLKFLVGHGEFMFI